MLALRLGQQADSREHLAQRKQNNIEKHQAAEAKEKAIDQKIAAAHLLERQMSGEITRATQAANLAKAMIELQQKLNGAHDLTQLFLEIGELDPADPDYYTQIAQLRLQYPQAALLPSGNKAIEDAIKTAAPMQAVYKNVREILGDLSAFTKRGPHGEFHGFNLRDAQDAALRIQKGQFNTLPAGSTATIPLPGGAVARMARPRRLDLTGLDPTPEAVERIHKKGDAAQKDLRSMLNGGLPLPGMAADVERVRRLTPSEQQQWIDDKVQEAMQQEIEGIKSAKKPSAATLSPASRASGLRQMIADMDRKIDPAIGEERARLKAERDVLSKQHDSLINPPAPAQSTPAQTAPLSIRDRVFGKQASAAPSISADEEVVEGDIYPKLPQAEIPAEEEEEDVTIPEEEAPVNSEKVASALDDY